MLGITAAQVEPVPAALEQVAVLTASPEWLTDRLKTRLFDAAKTIDPKGVRLELAEDQVRVAVIDGAVEVKAGGKASMADGGVSVKFSFVGWSTLKPVTAGFGAGFAIRELKLSEVHVAWEGHEAAFSPARPSCYRRVASSFSRVRSLKRPTPLGHLSQRRDGLNGSRR